MLDEKPVSELPTAVPPGILRDRRVLPEGVVPRQAQAYVVAGLALLILAAVMFSKNHARPLPKEVTSASFPVSSDVNQRKIQELEQDLTAAQQQALAERPVADSPNLVGRGQGAAPQVGGVSPQPQLPSPADLPRDPVADAERELAFKSRFVSNLVAADPGASRPEADLLDTSATRNSSLGSSPAAQAAFASVANKPAPEVSLNAAHGQPYVVFEGTTIDTVLANRLDGEFAGPVKVMATNPVYSRDRQHILIPEGTLFLGDVQKVASFGQKRLAVTFHRLLMPDGYSADLDQYRSLDQVGDTGLRGKVNNHYQQIFGSSIALGIIAGAAESTNTNRGYGQSGSEAYRSGIASSLSQTSANVLDRFINIPPTITIREGHRIKVYITQDMLLPAYENHTVPGDI